MSAAAAYFLEGGGLEDFAVFPEYPDLLKRGRQDGVDRLYVECFDRGELLTEGARVSDVGALLAEVRQRWGNPAAIVCDRWREAVLRQALETVSFPSCPLVVRGMGYQDGGAHIVAMMRPQLRFWPSRRAGLGGSKAGSPVCDCLEGMT